MSKRKHNVYGKLDKQRSSNHRAADRFAALSADNEVSASPPTKQLKWWSSSTRTSAREGPPAKKGSQAMEPSSENVATLVSMGLCNADTAKRYLKAKNNNVEQAAAALLDGEDLNATEQSSGWDDRVWSADRDGQTTDNDESGRLQPPGTSTAPTRGPSPAGSFRRPGTKAEEDEDLAKAMAASQGDIRYGEQETGIMRADGSTVKMQGPHLPGHYNERDWALVRVEQSTSEIIPDVDAAGRRHIPGHPRILKNTVHGDYLPNFLTICHNIPAVRELMLMPGYTRYDYGGNSDWWKGQSIVLPKVVHTTDGSPTDPILAKYDDFIAELQRLMVFLDCSDRGYASTANLEKTAGLRRHGKTAQSSVNTIVQTFIEELTAAAHSVSHAADNVERMFGLQAASADGAIDPHLVTVLDFDNEGEHTPLSELLDKTLWNNEDADEELVDYFVESLPEVMVLRLKQADSNIDKLGVDAPAQLYMDKYLKENVKEMRPLRQRMARERQRLVKISSVEQKLKKWKSARHNATFDADKLLVQTKSMLRPTDTDSDMVNGIPRSRDQVLADKLDKLTRSIEEKLVILDKERTKALAALSELSSPSHAKTLLGSLEHRFTLVGMSTKPTTTYLLRPKEAIDADQMLSDDQSDAETPPTYQWCRTEYSLHNTTASITCNTVAGYEALPAVRLEHTSALLIYASDAALDQRLVSNHNLPDALQDFVRRDNAFFEQELQAQPPPSYDFDEGIAMQTIERKQSDDSMRADNGSDTEMDPDPSTHASYGLGYGVRMEYQQELQDPPDPPVYEIKPPEGPASPDSGADVSYDEHHAPVS